MPVNKKAIEDIKNIYIETIAMGNLQRFYISNSNLYLLFNSTIIDFCNFISIPYQLLQGQKNITLPNRFAKSLLVCLCISNE